VMGQVDESTRLVALASCHFVSGYRIEVDAIGKFLRERGILFCLDAIQTLGAFPTTVEHVDILAADAHKWLLGPCGAGLLYVRQQVQSRVNPPIYGWHNVNCPDFVAQEQIAMRKDARKFEPGTHNLLGIIGVMSAIKLIQEVGVENISRELLRKRTRLVGEIQSKGYSVLHAELPPENCSSILSFYKPGQSASELYLRLLTANVITSLRVDRARQQYIRVSPHFYNTDAELDRMLALL